MPQLLRLLTCGSVDDGKSTLIGRLLHETGSIAEDQRSGLLTEDGEIDFSRLLDGLEAEREQGITIDVAYRVLQTTERRYLIADTPGHEQFTRNMATAAADADVAILLVDARKGVRDQTRRHAGIAAVMGIRHLVLAVNKMDLVAYSETVFTAIAHEFVAHARSLGLTHTQIQAIPMAAKSGHNVTVRADTMPWYGGPALLPYLTTLDISRTEPSDFRLPIQRVVRTEDFRGFAGTVRGGRVAPGDRIQILPGGRASRVARIVTADGDLPEATSGMAVTLELTDEVEAARGSMISDPDHLPVLAERAKVRLVWFGETPSDPTRPLLLRTPTDLVPARLTRLHSRLNPADLSEHPADGFVTNDIGIADIRLDRPVPLDPYSENRSTGSFLLIDRASNETLAAGMVLMPEGRADLTPASFLMDRHQRARRLGQRAAIIWMTGLSGSGKSTLAGLAEAFLSLQGHACTILDGDTVRSGLNRDLGFTPEDRSENIRRLAEVACLMADAGLIVFVAAITPRQQDRDEARRIAGDIPFFEVFVDTPLDVCISRDPKGLYAKARSGALRNMTGMGGGYEPPQSPNLHLKGGDGAGAEELALKLVDLVKALTVG
jgi:bifunctional enzyme CysN/CysC